MQVGEESAQKCHWALWFQAVRCSEDSFNANTKLQIVMMLEIVFHPVFHFSKMLYKLLTSFDFKQGLEL